MKNLYYDYHNKLSEKVYASFWFLLFVLRLVWLKSACCLFIKQPISSISISYFSFTLRRQASIMMNTRCGRNHIWHTHHIWHRWGECFLDMSLLCATKLGSRPPRSPDETDCDFFHWIYLKIEMYQHRPPNFRKSPGNYSLRRWSSHARQNS